MKFEAEYNFHVPVRFYYGYRRFTKLGELLKNMGGRFLLVTGKQSMKKLGFTQEAVKMLGAKGKKVVIYDQIGENPTTNMIDQGAKLAIDEKCDVIIGLGGGSAIDSAKGIAVVAGNGGGIWDYVEKKKSYIETLPIVAIPTTAGTGSESNFNLVVTNTEKRAKEGISNASMFPTISILDPSLTENLPAHITLNTAIDALGHCLESYVSTVENAASEMLSINGIWLIFRYLPSAIKDGKDKEARAALMLAASMGGIAIIHGGLGVPHTIAMKLGGLYNIIHGRAVGIVLPHSIERSRHKIENKLSILAGFLGVSKGKDVSQNAGYFIEALHNLITELNFPTRLREIGIEKEEIPKIVEKCIGDDDLETDPMYWPRNEIKEFLEKII